MEVELYSDEQSRLGSCRLAMRVNMTLVIWLTLDCKKIIRKALRHAPLFHK